VTNSSGESALTSSSRRPALVRASSARRSLGGSGGERASGARICATIGTNSSCQRRKVSASRALKAANEAMVFSISVHHSSARPSDVISATLSAGSISCAPCRSSARSAYHGMAVIARRKKACVL
jgi:hypothetical protein